MSGLNRRNFLFGAGAAGVVAAMPGAALAAGVPESFEFLFLTDTHTQPELNAVAGTDMAMKHARTFKADFAIQGGDHIFDALGVPKKTALQNFDLYDKTEQDLGMKVHHVIGNHDVLGVYKTSDVPSDDPLFGKKLFADRFGSLYYSFEHKGVRFIVLDSIGITSDHHYEPKMDDEQLHWLAAELAKTPVGAPIVVATHIPLVCAVAAYMPPAPIAAAGTGFVNGPAAIKLFEGHNVLGVLQGHNHINEVVEWHGVRYISSGAVCGNWWKGTRLGTPEGFTVASIANGKLTTRYETYGFQSVQPENT